MIIHYQNANGEEIYLRNIIYLQNIENGQFEVITANNKVLTLRVDRIEAIIDEELFTKK